MPTKDHELLRAVIRETLKAADVALSKAPVRGDASPHGMGKQVRVQLGAKTWLTSSQSEVDRVLAAGGRVVKEG